MERELGISYPTVRGRLEALLHSLDLADESVPDTDPAMNEPMGDLGEDRDETERTQQLGAARKAILERLARHEMAADEAAEALRSLGGS
jgi:hypothetical protein